MIGKRAWRTAATLGLAVAAVLSFTVATPGTASAVATRTITGRTECAFNLPFGFSYSYASPSATDWTPWLTTGISVIAIDSVSKTWSTTIPATAGIFALDTFCYVDQSEYNGTVNYGTGQYLGFSTGLTPGTSTIQSTWGCYRRSGGGWGSGAVRACTRTS
jgi:hypothetical protein